MLVFTYAQWRGEAIYVQQLAASDSGLYYVHAKVLHGQLHRSAGDIAVKHLVQTTQLSDYGGRLLTINLISLKSYGDFALVPGANCRFYARLRSPVGKRNPGSVNQERAYFKQGIGALGYVVDHPANYCDPTREPPFLSRLRSRVTQALDDLTTDSATREVLRALSIAERGSINERQWQVLRETGTTHLLAISGLHISLIATVAFYSSRLAMLIVLPRRFFRFARVFALINSLLAAAFYAGLANFSLPTVRALLMVGLAVIALLNNRAMLSFGVLCSVATLMLLWDPFIVLGASFWLSFGAVSLLISMRALQPRCSWIRQSLRTHLFLSLGLLPIASTLSPTVPISSPLANFLAVPVVGLLIVPLVLCGIAALCLNVPLVEPCWELAAMGWQVIWQCLDAMATYSPDLALAMMADKAQFAVAFVAISIMLVPLIPRRWVFISICLLQLLIKPARSIAPGDFHLTVLDVGQGLSIIVRTANHVLVYDTGPAFARYSAANAIVIPALKYFDENEIDHLMISHADNDHAGGLSILMDEFTVKRVSASYSSPKMNAAPICEANQSWTWDEVEFDVLWPRSQASEMMRKDANNNSCVLKISSRAGAALLPGDIELPSEQQLLRMNSALQADILIAPHHGSRTSSSEKFIRAVKPKYVVFAVGFQNRFNFPDEAVYQRYKRLGITSFISSETGAITFEVGGSGITRELIRDKPLNWWQAMANH